MTYDPRDTDPLQVDEVDWPWNDQPHYVAPVKSGVPRPVLYYGIGALIVIVAVLVIAGWVR
jgi:hypothetical protein